MPRFMLSGNPVKYQLGVYGERDGEPITDAEDIVKALGYSDEVVDDIQHGVAIDVQDEIGKALSRAYGPPDGDIKQLELNGYVVRYCGQVPDGVTKLMDFVHTFDGKPWPDGLICMSDFLYAWQFYEDKGIPRASEDEEYWVSFEAWTDYMGARTGRPVWRKELVLPTLN